jgi:tetratricopeptide (TPR) repeat protein
MASYNVEAVLSPFLRWFQRAAAAVFIVWLALAAGRTEAVEEAREFVDALRRNGYYDEAIAYLEQQRTAAHVGAAFQETIDYDLGLTLLESARGAGVVAQRQERLRDAQKRLAAFLAEHPNHPLAAAAGNALADALLGRGRLQVAEAGEWGKGSAERRQRLESARGLFLEAHKALAEIDSRADESRKKLGFVDPRDLKKCQARDNLRRQQLQAQLAGIWAHDEIAQTYEAGSPEYRQTLLETAQQFSELHEKQGDQLAGLYARLGEASCYRRLGEPRKAFAIFEGLLIWPDEPPAFRTMKTLAAVAALETALLPGVNKYKEAMDISQKWLLSAQRGELSSQEGLAIRFLGAEAAMAYAQTLQDAGPEETRLRQKCLQEAREGYTQVAAAAGPYQQKAKIRLLEPALVAAAERAPASFAEARDRLAASMERAQAAEAEVRLASGKDLQTRRDCQVRLETIRAEAIRLGRLALHLAPPEAPAEDVSEVRYYLAYLCFTAGDMEEAAVLGEFLAGHAGDGAAGREGGKIALAAYDDLFRHAPPGEERRLARQRLLRLAESVAKRWSTHSEADDARIVLLEAALDDGRLDQARQCLDAISIDSPRRGEAEMGLGHALWVAYRRALRLPDAQRPSKDELGKMAAQAEQLLTSGIQRARDAVEAGGAVSDLLAAASLAMAEISLSAGRPEQAVQWLEDPKFGAKTLVDARDAAAQWSDFPAQTQRVALRVYVAAGQEEAGQAEEGERAMLELENVVRQGDAADAGKRLTDSAVRLGQDVQEQIEQFQQQGKGDQATRWIRAMDAFLTRIAGARDRASFFRLHAVAETFFGLGRGLDPRPVTASLGPGAKASQDAQKYYSKAAEAFRELLRRCDADKTFAPQAEAVTAVRVRLGSCLRRLGQYPEALDVLSAVLKEHGMLVDAQVEAAYIYQAWGEERPECYEFAVQGNPASREVWGWGELSRRVESVAKYEEVFFEARYNLALCRFRQAQAQTDPQERGRRLQAAERDLLDLERLYPDAFAGDGGGKSWPPKLSDLLRQIRQSRSESKE